MRTRLRNPFSGAWRQEDPQDLCLSVWRGTEGGRDSALWFHRFPILESAGQCPRAACPGSMCHAPASPYLVLCFRGLDEDTAILVRN